MKKALVKTKKTSLKKKKIATEVKQGHKKDEETKGRRYYEAVGRRKTAIARVRLFTTSPSESAMANNFIINNKHYKEFFSTLALQGAVESPLIKLKSLNRFSISVIVKGGGIRGQAEAIRHGISRALILFDINFRKKLKKIGYLTRDPRKKERKKFGLKKARRAPQWSKR